MFTGLIASFVAMFAAQFNSVVSAVTGSISTIILELPTDEQKILHDAMNQALQDIQGGKSAGTAIADAYTSFYNAERGEVSKVSKQLLTAFVTALGASKG